VVLDVTDRAAMAVAAAEAEAAFGKVHVLVNNAGVGILGPIKLARYGDWDWGLGVNLGGVVNGIQEFLPYILKHGEGGHIVNTASMAALVPIPNASIYIAAKAALVGLSESLRAELAADNIGVSAFCPGPVQTNIGQVSDLRPERYRGDTGFGDFEAMLAKRPTATEWMDPREVGRRVLTGIRNNEIFILTHREFREGAEARMRAILAAFPDEAIDEARKAAILRIVANPMYDEHLAARGS
jgi:NAD(P)-dependent dehydrogenase (short-subunit alcohol dehydrogenase family)